MRKMNVEKKGTTPLLDWSTRSRLVEEKLPKRGESNPTVGAEKCGSGVVAGGS